MSKNRLVLPSGPSFGFLPTAAVGALIAGGYLLSAGAPPVPTATVIVVSVVVLALAALGRKGLSLIVVSAAIVMAVGSTVVDLDDRIPTAGEVAADLGDSIGDPSLPDVDIDVN